MIEITIYRRDTGAIQRTGSFPDVANALANVGEGEGWVAGVWDGATHYVRDEKPVPRLLAAIDTSRPLRDQMLAASDWTQLPDAPLSEAQRAEWREYRQALRDLPETGVWPEHPDTTE